MSAEAGTRRRFRTEAAAALYQRSVFGKNGTGTTGWLNGLAASLDAIEAEVALAGTLDEAWAEAEAALPAGHTMDLVLENHVDGGRYLAWTMWHADTSIIRGTGPTPAAALHAFVAALRGVPA